MTVIIDGTTGISTPGVTNSGNETVAGTLQVGGIATNLYPLVSGTAVTLTTQTSVDFTGIPSTAKRITVMFSGVSTNGTAQQQIQLGDSGGFEITGYVGTGTSNSTGANPVTSNCTTGFALNSGSNAAQTQQGIATICLLGSNTWVFSFVGGRDNAVTNQGAGTKTLSDTLTQLRVIGSATGSPSDTFDAGSINIMWE